MAEEKKLNKKWLEGLEFRYSEPKVEEKDGRKVRRYVQKTRPVEPEDVLSFKDYGDHVVLVIADGQKVRVDKNPKKQNGDEKKGNGK